MKKITFATRELNKLLDETLMDKHHFASETLMELAGLAAAQVANSILRKQRHHSQVTQQDQSISVLIGPGNNGGTNGRWPGRAPARREGKALLGLDPPEESCRWCTC